MDLRGRPHIVLAWDDAAPTAGRIEDHGDIRRIVLDDRLERVERSITLAHELIHDEWNIFYDDDTTDREVELQERRIWREVARRLVPPPLLLDFVRRRASVEPITYEAVAAEFDVDERIAALALRLVEDELAA